MPVDLTVFERQKSIVDQRQLQDAFELKKALAIQEAQKSAQTQDLNAQLKLFQLQGQQEQRDIQRENLAAQKAYRQESMAFRQQQADAENEYRGARLANKKITLDPDTGEIGVPPVIKPLPVGALKMQNDIVDSFSAAKNAQDLSKSIVNNIDSGSLDLGPVSNFSYKAQNFAGYSTPKSQAFGNLQTSLENLRNETLLLHKGVQTEGDAVRALNAITTTVNDPKLLKANMEKLNSLNMRAAEIQKQKLNAVRANYGLEPYDFGQIESLNAFDNFNVPPPLPVPSGAVPQAMPPGAGSTPPPLGNPLVQRQQGASSIKEGTTATNPRTGQKITFRNGQWQ